MGNKHPQGYAVGDRSISWEPDYRFRTVNPHAANTLPSPVTPGHYPMGPPGPMPLYRPPGVPLMPRPSTDNGSVIRDGAIDSIQKLDSDLEKNSNESKKSQPGTNDSGYLTTSNGEDSSGRRKMRNSNMSLNEPVYGQFMPPPAMSPMMRPPGPMYGPGPHIPPHMMGPGPYHPGFPPGYPPGFTPVSPDGRKRRGWKKKNKLSKSQLNLYQGEPAISPPMPGHYRFVPQGAMARAQSFDDILTPGIRHIHPAFYGTQMSPTGPHRHFPGGSMSPGTSKLRRPSPDGQEKADENSQETGSDNSKVVKAELHHSADAAKPKVRDAIYETLKQGKPDDLKLKTSVKISPEAKAIMDRNADILGTRMEENKQKDSAGEKLSPDDELPPPPKLDDSPDPSPNSATEESPQSSEKENTIEPSMVPYPPKRHKNKQKALFPALEAWDMLNVSEEISLRHVGPETPDESITEETLVPKIVQTPPPRRQSTEPIYLEYDDRLLPEFKKRLIETGSFDFVPEKRSLGSNSSIPKKSSRNGSEKVVEAQTKRSWKSNDKAYYPAQNEIKRFQSQEDIDKPKVEEKSGLGHLKSSVANVFRRTKSSDKVLDEPKQEKSDKIDPKAGPIDNSVIDFSWVDDLEHKFHSSNLDQEILRQQRDQMRRNENIDVYGTLVREKERVDNAVTIPVGFSRETQAKETLTPIRHDPGAVEALRQPQGSPGGHSPGRNVYKLFEEKVGVSGAFSHGYAKRQIIPDDQGHPLPNQNSPQQNSSANQNGPPPVANVAPAQISPVRDMTSREALLQNEHFDHPRQTYMQQERFITEPLRPPQRLPNYVSGSMDRATLDRQRSSPPDQRSAYQPEQMILEHNPLHNEREQHKYFGQTADRPQQPKGVGVGAKIWDEVPEDHHRRYMNFDAPIYKHVRGKSESDLLNSGYVVRESPKMHRTQLATSTGHLKMEHDNVQASRANGDNVFIPAPDYDTSDIPRFEAVYGSAKNSGGQKSSASPSRPSNLEFRRQNWNNSWDYPTPGGSSPSHFYQGRTKGSTPSTPVYANRQPQADRQYDSTEYYRKNILGERNRQQMKAMKKHGFEKAPPPYF